MRRRFDIPDPGEILHFAVESTGMPFEVTVTNPSPRAVAPAWHTAIVLSALLGMSIVGALAGVGAHGRVGGYVLAMIFEWAITGFIWHGLSRRGINISELVGGSWARPLAVIRDIAIAIGFLVIANLALGGLGYLLKATTNQATRNMLPHGPTEVTVYLLLVVTAGFCEELIFRGYLQRQFTALTRAAAGGIALQGVVFGASHGYQGWKSMLIITVYGVMFGLLAHWRRSLRPGMVAHLLQDGVGGLLSR
jgi:membrane protease YdiL (CAAX protease family)